jgi:septum formation protein
MTVAAARKTLILASASPRRLQLLADAGFAVQAVPANVPEELLPDEPPPVAANRLACIKAECISSRYPEHMVLGADTIVVCGKHILGKPQSMREAAEMLQMLSGKEHEVLTGVALRRQKPALALSWVSRTAVQFRTLTASEVKEYLARVNPLDKAGAYAIQEEGERIIESIRGSRSNVVGLPIEEVIQKLSEQP